MVTEVFFIQRAVSRISDITQPDAVLSDWMVLTNEEHFVNIYCIITSVSHKKTSFKLNRDTKLSIRCAAGLRHKCVVTMVLQGWLSRLCSPL